jgi:general secretion pathway protein B
VSYILDALNKAERDRQVSRVPGLATTHGGVPSVRPALWPWVAAGALVVSAVLGYSLFRPGRPEPAGEAVPPPATAGPASISSARHGPSPSPVDRASKQEEPAVASGPDVGRASPPLEPARPRVAGRAPPAGTPKAARAAVAQPRAPAVASPDSQQTDSHETRRAGATQPSAPPPAAVAPGPPPAAAAGQGAGPAATEPPATPLTLDVLVYSDVPAERMVFINGRKYVEGQTVNEDAVVEQITQEGAILRRQGKQIVLRPRLNPYARPGSP